MWNILSKDWDKKTSKEQCLENVIKHAESGRYYSISRQCKGL